MRRTRIWPIALLTLDLAVSVGGCGHARTYGPRDRDRPPSGDYVELPMVPWEHPELLEYHQGMCPEHGNLTSRTNDRPAVERAVAAHDVRFHHGQERAGIVTDRIIAD